MARILRQIVYFVWIGLDIEKHFDRPSAKELRLLLVELACPVKLTPLSIGQHDIAVVILQAVKVEGLVAANVLVFSLAQRTD